MAIEAFRSQLFDSNIKMDKCGKDVIYFDISTSILVGFVGYIIEQRGIKVYSLIVHNGFRLNGVGSDLLDHVVTRGLNMGKLFIDTIVHEEAAVGWLKANGFVASGLKKNYFGDRDGIQFRKML